MYYSNVDCVGVEAVCKLIHQTGLKRFIIYRQGAAKGSTPVYDCSQTTNNAAALKLFRDWATNVGNFNPHNGLCYDILLFNNDTDVEQESTGKKANKIRFSFALNHVQMNGQMGQQNQSIDIEGAIAKGIRMGLMEKELDDLRKFKKDYEEGNLDDDDNDDDSLSDTLGTIKDIMTEMNTNNEQKIKAAAMAGDDDGDESLDTEAVVEEKIKKKFTPEQIEKKKTNVKKAMAILWTKNSNLDQDLLRLAKLAKTNPILFKMTIQKLRGMIKDVSDV